MTCWTLWAWTGSNGSSPGNGGDNMTTVQEIILTYVKTQWDMAGIQVKCQGDDMVVITTDSNGDKLN